MDVSLYAVVTGGVLTLMMGVFHLRFYALFGWSAEFEALSERSRRIVFTIHLGLLLLFFGLGGTSLVFARTLAAAEGLALGVDLLLALFWGWRAVWQAAYFRPPPGRRGVRMRRLHVALIVVFLLLALAYAVPLVVA